MNTKQLRTIAKANNMTTSDVMATARDLGLNFEKVLGTWILKTDMTTANAFAEHLSETA